jgi:Sensors of blue-light using FAD
MHRLSYHSHALAASPADLDAIYAEASALNAPAGITGALLYLDGRWAQILEGDQAAITGLYDRISRDARHDQVTFGYLIETESRLFPDWSMARITNDDKADIPRARIFAAVTAADTDTHIRQLRSLAQTASAPLADPDRAAETGTRRSPAATRPAETPSAAGSRQESRIRP